MKTFKQYNESIRDKMTPKPMDEVWDAISNMTLLDKIKWMIHNGGSNDLFEYEDLVNEFEVCTLREKRDIVAYAIKTDILSRPTDIRQVPDRELSAVFKVILRFYFYIGESIRDKMIPKSDDELKVVVDGYTPKEKMLRAIEIDIDWLADDAIKSGLDVNDCINDSGWTYLMAACEMSRVDIVILLLEADANVNHKDVYGNTALSVAHWSGRNEDIIDILKNKGANIKDLNESVRDMMTPKSEEDIENSMKGITLYRTGKVYNGLISRLTGKVTEKVLKHLPLIVKCHQEVFYNPDITVDKYLKEGWKSIDYRQQIDVEDMLKLSFEVTIKKNKKKFLFSQHKNLKYLHCSFINPTTNRLDMTTIRTLKEFKKILNEVGLLYESIKDLNESVRDKMTPISKERYNKYILQELNKEKYFGYFNPFDWGLTFEDTEKVDGTETYFIFKSPDGRRWKITIFSGIRRHTDTDYSYNRKLFVREMKRGVSAKYADNYKDVEEYLLSKGLKKIINESLRDTNGVGLLRSKMTPKS